MSLTLQKKENKATSLEQDKQAGNVINAERDKILKAAKNGDRESQCRLGDMLNSTNPKEALSWYLKSANQGHVQAADSVAISYYYGVGVKENPDKAAEWYAKAAKLGNEDSLESLKDMADIKNDNNKAAQFELGKLYFEGIVVQKDITKAVDLFTQSAKEGHAGAQCELGKLLLEGNGLKKDLTKAAALFKQAAEQNHAEAQHELAKLYLEGNGVEKDILKSADLFIKADISGHFVPDYSSEGTERSKLVKLLTKETEHGNKEALEDLEKIALIDSKMRYQVGVLYAEGKGVKQDLNKAIEFFALAGTKNAERYLEKLADGGNTNAQYQLGIIREDPEQLLKAAKQNHNEAFQALKKMLEDTEGWRENYPELQYEVGVLSCEMYKDRTVGAELLREAAEEAIKQDKPDVTGRAVTYLKTLADKGNSNAMCYYAEYYYDHPDTDNLSSKIPYEYLGKAAAAGNKNALSMLINDGVDNEDSEALYQLGKLFATGKGVERNLSEGRDYLEKALVGEGLFSTKETLTLLRNICKEQGDIKGEQNFSKRLKSLEIDEKIF